MSDKSKTLSFIKDGYIKDFVMGELLPQIRDSSRAEATAIVSTFFLEKATKTLDAICLLCQNGFPEDALILGRTILELYLYIENIAFPESIDQRKIRAESFIYDGDRQRVEKLKEFEELKHQGKCKSWIDEIEANNPVMETVTIPKDFVPLKKLKAIATELGGEWECYYYFVYWSISKLTHPSGLGSHTYVQKIDVDAEISRAIAVAFPMHCYLTRTALNLLGLNKLWPKLDSYMSNFIALES